MIVFDGGCICGNFASSFISSVRQRYIVGSMCVRSSVATSNVGLMLEQEADEFTRQNIQAVADFLQNPVKISITLSPEHPQSIARVMRATQPRERRLI